MNKPIAPVKRVKLLKFEFSKERLFKSLHFKIGLGYTIAAITAITAFFYAKKDVTENRLRNMRVKDEINKVEIAHSDRFQRIVEKNRRFEEKQRKNEQENK